MIPGGGGEPAHLRRRRPFCGQAGDWLSPCKNIDTVVLLLSICLIKVKKRAHVINIPLDLPVARAGLCLAPVLIFYFRFVKKKKKMLYRHIISNVK